MLPQAILNHDPAKIREAFRRLRLLEQRESTVGDEFALLVAPDQSSTMRLPPAVYSLLVELVRHLEEGNAVSIIPASLEVSPKQAADFLNVSRTHVMKLISEGILPSRRVGTHHRVRYDTLVEYKSQQEAEQLQALKELVEMSEESGLYGSI